MKLNEIKYNDIILEPYLLPREQTNNSGRNQQFDEYRMKGVEEVKYMRGEEDRVNARNQENLEKSSAHKTKLHKEVPGANTNRANIHTSESQQEFFRMLDEKIEKGPDYCSEEEDVT
uniref:Zgc:92140 n=1 Tax=Astyanax mexicanus TaxID=7994 RepID=A0A3B1KJ55_ASTMX